MADSTLPRSWSLSIRDGNYVKNELGEGKCAFLLVALFPCLICFILLLTVLVVLILPSLVIPFWYKTATRIETQVGFNSQNAYSGLLSQVETIAHLLNSSLSLSAATNLARFLNSSANATQQLSFDDVRTKVAPSLFQAFSTVPYMSQISFIGLEGLFFSYHLDRNQTLALYSNSTLLSSNSSSSRAANADYFWYKQPVNIERTGELYGEAIKAPQPLSATVNSSWFQETLNRLGGYYASLGRSWNSEGDFLLLNSARINGKAVVSLGFSVRELTSFFTDINLYGGYFYLAASENQTVLIQGIQKTNMVVFANHSISLSSTEPRASQVLCNPSNRTASLANFWDLGETNYDIYCGILDLFGIQTVYVLALPHKRLARLVQTTARSALILLLVMIVVMVISVFGFVLLMMRGAKREMHLCAKLIQQMEATQQAERKSMDKSLAISRASHDIRASLSAIIGLIDICYELIPYGSDMHANLKEMETSAKELLGLLNSILDISKLEAGKMQLEEEKFNLDHLLEHVADLFHPLAAEKGVDVVLDPCDGSVLKFSKVKGDRQKLYQILINLLSNAVKFTEQGHVSLRAWAQKPTLGTEVMIASKRGSFSRYLSCFFCKNKKMSENLKAVNVVTQNLNVMEFVFEVDDTGKGIPKEKQKSVFENYAQVKENSPTHKGTGLGLGIVRLLVRLMSGEVEIVDKEIGEKGTCFRFNVFLTTFENPPMDNTSSENNVFSENIPTGGAEQVSGLTACAPTANLSICISSPRLQSILTPSPKPEGSQVILLIQKNERRRIVQKFMVSRGINVAAINQWDHLSSTLQRMKYKLISPYNSSGKSEWSSRSDISCSSSKDVPLSTMDGSEQRVPHNKRRVAPCFFLLVIDVTAGPFQELFKAVAEFRRGLGTSCCKVVWLDKPKSGKHSTRVENEDCDEILRAPFHGSRLYRVIELIPGHEGSLLHGTSLVERDETFRYKNINRDPSSSAASHYHITRKGKSYQHEEIKEACCSGSGRLRVSVVTSGSRKHRNQKHQVRPNVAKGAVKTEEAKLSGKTILVVDDVMIQRKIASMKLQNHGAVVEECEDGKQVLDLVRQRLRTATSEEGSSSLPYDLILMDCEMKGMDGYEATRQIREEESRYGTVHVPIIALTANAEGEVASKIGQAGMDYHLGKPLQMNDLFKVLKIPEQ